MTGEEIQNKTVNLQHTTPGLLDQVASYVKELLHTRLSKDYSYHNYQHTSQLAAACTRIAEHYSLTGEDLENLLIAAWFQDTGYCFTYSGHEIESVRMAEDYLSTREVSNARKSIISELILSTRVESQPDTLLKKILHDAGILNTGKKSFFDQGQLLRNEWQAVLNQSFTDEKWEHVQLDFLTKSNFLTTAAQNWLGPRRVKNIEKQQSRLKKLYKNRNRDSLVEKTGRGTETMYRVTYRNHVNLSAIADNKANMMLSLNSIILSSIVAIIGSGLAFLGNSGIEYFRFGIPIAILLLSCLGSLIFAIQSAKPNITHNISPDIDLIQRKSSILFFGNFTQLPLERYLSDMELLRADNHLLYENMSIDLYNLGLVLRRKYHLVKVSYNIFMFGITLAVLAFAFIMIYSTYLSNHPIF